MLSEQARKKVAAQRERYIESMPEKKRTIEQCLDQVSDLAGDGQTRRCDKLFQQVHRLAGSAGSYGFDSLGQAASVVDRYLVAHSPGFGESSELASMLQMLLEEIDKIIPNRA